MTAEDVAAIVEGLAPVILELVAKAHADLRGQHAAHVVDATKELGAMRERLATLEARAPVPGPPGPAGQDGTDGLGFDDLSVEQLDLRTIAVKAIRGAQVKTIGTVQFPVPAYRKIWTPDREYTPGDSVTWAGSVWYCDTATSTKPGEGSKDWTLQCKRGKDGRDGKDGTIGPPGPAGRDWQQVYDDTRRR
jgi:integrin beta 3